MLGAVFNGSNGIRMTPDTIKAAHVDRFWIAEIPVRATKVVLIPAPSFREAQAKLRAGDYPDGIDTINWRSGTGRVVGEDKTREH